ncbi:uncharacterized protein PHACADRAFT_201628 [Phanerochaete carnosa HHB-10118-sp]|uniref:Uncharacterized protein n=1 Tax=Phanerochaete carnosa (strain HHB-10118-sp) TaxID=650164 RepID=K5VRJ7_PHACS|nr:uncharacterized protein PHACADRAFT_201628 [Phanerochaete carnosa HHB-10118-sp]EKM49370.1 hypothetical protein PHACADRAFT_201628 [Phanerochaete carnosa HHB-10118-sp]
MGLASDAELVNLHLSISRGGAPSVYEAALPQIKEEDEEHRRALCEISNAGGMFEEVTTEFEDFITETRNELNGYHAKFAKTIKRSKQSLDILGETLEETLAKMANGDSRDEAAQAIEVKELDRLRVSQIKSPVDEGDENDKSSTLPSPELQPSPKNKGKARADPIIPFNLPATNYGGNPPDNGRISPISEPQSHAMQA